MDSLYSPEEGWKGPRPLTMAGLFDTWKSEDGTLINSFSVVTMDSCPAFSWIHERMPAILETEDDVNSWLDTARVPPKQALSHLKPSSILVSHPVSTVVGNVKNHGKELVQPIDLTKPKSISGSVKFMASWLKKATPGKKEEQKSFVDMPKEGVKRALSDTFNDREEHVDVKPVKLFKEEN